MRYRAIVDAVTREEWAALASGFRDNNLQQNWDYGEMAAAETGSVSTHAVVSGGEAPVALAQCRVKTLPVVGLGIGYVAAGPLIARSGCEADIQDILVALREEYVVRRGLVLRLAPGACGSATAGVAEAFRSAGFAESAAVHPYRTIIVDLEQDLSVIRRGLRQKWRNCLNRSEREELEVRSGTDDDVFESFCRLYGDLLERKTFDAPFGAAFYRRLQNSLPGPFRLRVTIAVREGRPVAGHVSSALGDTCVYVLGASNEEGLATKAAYLLQWAVIVDAKARGMRRYDLGGIDADANPGVCHFKRGLGGVEAVAPGPFEAAPGRMRASAVAAMEKAYRAFRAGRERGRRAEEAVTDTAGGGPGR